MNYTFSSPGKLMLFGDHAVVYGQPCLVTAVDSRLYVSVEKNYISGLDIHAPQVKSAKFLERAIANFKGKYNLKINGLKISTHSKFSCNVGFGSSSAVTVSALWALAKFYQIPLTKKQLFDLAYQTVLDIQGVGSGFDIAAAIWGGTIYFKKGGEVVEEINLKSASYSKKRKRFARSFDFVQDDKQNSYPLPIIVAYSGSKGDTPRIVKQVARKRAKQKPKYEQIFSEIGKLVTQSKEAMVKNNWEKVGVLMNRNQQLLQQIEVSTDKLDKMCAAAVSAGAWGAKLSGAGGGDCMIAVVSDNKRREVEKAIESVGGEIMPVNLNAEGAKLEFRI